MRVTADRSLAHDSTGAGIIARRSGQVTGELAGRQPGRNVQACRRASRPTPSPPPTGDRPAGPRQRRRRTGRASSSGRSQPPQAAPRSPGQASLRKHYRHPATPITSQSAPSRLAQRRRSQPLRFGRENVDSASGPACAVLRWCGRRVGSLGPGLTSDSADAARAVLRDDLSAGPQVFTAPAGGAGLICPAWTRGRGSQVRRASGCVPPLNLRKGWL